MSDTGKRKSWATNTANLICGERRDAAPDVAHALKELAALIEASEVSEDMADNRPPKRAEARDAIAAIRHHAVMLRWAMTRTIGQEALAKLSSPVRAPRPGETELSERLADLAGRAQIALSRIPDHRGGGRLGDSSKLTAPKLAARCVVRLWEIVHGEPPAERNADAWDACSVLLAKATADRLKGRAWERHLVDTTPCREPPEGRTDQNRLAALLGADLHIDPILERHFPDVERYSAKTGE